MRKEPRQERSKATVDAVIHAAARILSDQGWAGFTTNRVAETAGVSIGSLYQYFPDKISIVEAVRYRHLEDCLSVMKSVSQRRQSLAKFVEELVTGMIAVHSIHPGLHKVLLDDAPSHEGTNDPNSAFEREYLCLYAAAIAAHMAADSKADAKTAALIVSDAIDGIIHNAARRGELQSPKVRQEMISLVNAYLSLASGE
ncbi:TetR/AcrR family transcriptional regulator [Agrobacterium fabrum]|uniref:TetR/AcrR family transcriptional regulator n=1 Tax=Agrobacterium fabrum TaxID=1176649 RepID=UPI003B9F7E78